jgi:hypothetical protein
MRDLSEITAKQILDIKEIEPERLFNKDAVTAKAEYRALAMQWHPDHNAGDELAGKVFAHISVLFSNAERWLEQGMWDEPKIKIEDEEVNILEFKAIDDIEKPVKRIRYLKHVPFELGDIYIANTLIAYVINNKYAEFFENAYETITHFQYKSDQIKNDIQRCLPKIITTFLTNDKMVILLEKRPDLIRLRDVLNHFDAKIDPKHVAWIQNNLHNLSCYLEQSGLVHNSISPDDYFVDLKNHSGALLGGWWFSTHVGKPLKILTARSAAYGPPATLRSKISSNRLDLELIKATGRELLGDISGTGLALDKTIPHSMALWLRHPTTGNAIEDYTQWKESVLPASFGERRFIKLELNASDIYKEK